MIRRNPTGHFPSIPESAFVDPTAIVCGKVEVGEDVFIGPYAVIRADEVDAEGKMEPIIIGARSNIQDGVVIHSKAGAGVSIGADTSIAHRAIVHGPVSIGEHVFIGFNAVVFNCHIGGGCVIRHNSVVEGCKLPDGFHVPATSTVHNDTDLASIPRVDADSAGFSESVIAANRWLVAGYKRIANEL